MEESVRVSTISLQSHTEREVWHLARGAKAVGNVFITFISKYFALFSVKTLNDRVAKTGTMISRTCSKGIANKLFGRDEVR